MTTDEIALNAIWGYFVGAPVLAFACAWLAHRRGATTWRWAFGIAVAIILAAVAFSHANLRFTQGWLEVLSICATHFSYGLAAFCLFFVQKRFALAGRVIGMLLALPFLVVSWYLFGAFSAFAVEGALDKPRYVQQLTGDRTCRLYEAGFGHSRTTLLHIDRQLAPGIKQLISVQDLGSCDGGCGIDGTSACGAVP